MGAEFEKNLDNAKHDLYAACIWVNKYLEAPYPENINYKKVATDLVEKAIAKVEGLDK